MRPFRLAPSQNHAQHCQVDWMRGSREMEAKSVAKSIEMFKALLEGKTYYAIAKESGLTRSAVEQRVKALARDLQTIVGVEGVDEDEVPTARAMRAQRDSYVEALEHYRPQHRLSAGKRSRALTTEDMERAVAMTRQRSSCRNRDVALLLVLFSTAAKPLEIARLEVRDYLSEDGSVREESVLRADAAINGKARPLFFASASVVAAIDAYLEERIRRGQGMTTCAAYRGLDPQSGLFLTANGDDMPIRVRAIGNRKHHLCSMIHDIYRKAFARAGFNDVSALCARRTVAKRLAERGCNVDQVGSILGLTDRNSVRNLIQSQQESARSLKAVLRELV
jgi:integrase